MKLMNLKLKTFWLLWFLDIILFVTIMLIPKNEFLYNIFFIVFVGTAGVFPLIGAIYALYALDQGFDPTRYKVATFPVAASIFMVLMSNVYFIKAIVEEKRLELILASSSIALLLIGLAFIIKLLKHTTRRIVLLSLLGLVLYFGFIYYCVNLSFDYSVLW
jgi:hypothetical protein